MNPPDWAALNIPFVGVGCIVTRGDGKFLLVRNHGGGWSPPGGHLDFGESLSACAARETLEETGVRVSGVEFVAITNDRWPDADKHYLTVWMRADALMSNDPLADDPVEIAESGWFAPDALPTPLALYFNNLLAGRCLPVAPLNLPFAIQRGAGDDTPA